VYYDSHVFVSASEDETFGLALVEAALHGCEIVCSDLPVFRELDPGIFDFVRQGDPDDLKRALEDHLTAPSNVESACEPLAKLAIQTGVKAFVSRHLHLYESLLSS